MRIHLLCLLITCFVARYHACANVVQREYVIPFHLTDFVISQNPNGLTTIDSNKQFIVFESDSTKPALPNIPINILLNADETISDMCVIFNSDTVLNQINMAACPALYPTNENHFSIQPIQSTWPDTIYQKRAEFVGTSLMDGYKFASIILVPFEYNTGSACLRFFRDITIRLSVESPKNAHNSMESSMMPINVGNNMRDFVQEIIVNTDEMKSFYQHPQRSILDEDDYEYLIVTADQFATTMQELAEWKTMKGIKTKVLTTTDIYSSYPSGSNQYKIKCALKDYYNGQHQGLRYVLLAGTTAFVPTQLCDVKVINSTMTYHDSTPTDLYYACFDTMDWDTNGNGIHGEVEDQIDISPEIVVTRALINSVTEAQFFVRRIIDYERNPLLETWEDNILLAGAKLHQDTTAAIDGHIRSDAEYYGDQLINALAPIWNGYPIKLFDTYTDFSGGATYQFNTQHLQEELSKGYTFVNLDTHGAYEHWATEESPYTAINASELNNSGHSIIITSSCNVNHFDTIPCLSHSFISNPNGGILAFIGPSRLGWSPTSQSIIRALYRQLFDYKGRLGNALTHLKALYAPFCRTIGINDAKRWLMFTTNAIADPEMPIYLSEPRVMTGVGVSLDNGVLGITTGMDSCNICVMSTLDNGGSIYNVSNNVSSCSLSSVNTNVSVCITHVGYIPYLVDVSPHVYIQDETLEGHRHIVGEHIDVGFDVTSTKPEGDVTVNDGKIILSGSKNVTIKNSFEIKKGSILIIKHE